MKSQLNLRMQNKKCSKCGYSIYHIINNLYRCPSCGYVLLEKKGSVSLEKTDLRKFTLKWEAPWDIVDTTLYQLDLIKIIRMSQHLSCLQYVDKLTKFIRVVDKLESANSHKVVTNLNPKRDLPRIFLSEVLKK